MNVYMYMQLNTVAVRQGIYVDRGVFSLHAGSLIVEAGRVFPHGARSGSGCDKFVNSNYTTILLVM